MSATTPTVQSWRPLLSGAAAEAARETVFAIAADLSTPAPDPELQSPLAGGPAGKALFFAYAHQEFPDQGWDDTSALWMEEALAAAASTPMGPSLFSGFAGVGWVLRHLDGRIFEESPEEEDPGSEVEEILLQALVQPSAHWPAELILGLAGFGVYFLERLPREGARRGVALVIDRLAQSAETLDGGVSWFTPPEAVPPLQKELAPAGYYNLGVSHGVPGVIGFLAAALQRGRAEAVRPLLTEAMSWLLAQRLPEGAGGCFGSFVIAGAEPQPSRLAWCYGDPGIASVLLTAARSLGRRDWEEVALACARHAAGQRGQETGAVDPGLCHGTAGLVHIFNRLFQSTGEEAFREAALHWLEQTLAMRRPGIGVGGFQSLDLAGEGRKVWRDDPGFLTGSAGIGLALLAALSPIEPEWDRVLLLSI